MSLARAAMAVRVDSLAINSVRAVSKSAVVWVGQSDGILA